jgi:hypothetical protein
VSPITEHGSRLRCARRLIYDTTNLHDCIDDPARLPVTLETLRPIRDTVVRKTRSSRRVFCSPPIERGPVHRFEVYNLQGAACDIFSRCCHLGPCNTIAWTASDLDDTHHLRDPRGALGRLSVDGTRCDDDIDLEPDQFLCQLAQGCSRRLDRLPSVAAPPRRAMNSRRFTGAPH